MRRETISSDRTHVIVESSSSSKSKNYFFGLLNFGFFKFREKNFRDLNELEEIDKVEVKKEPVILNY